MLLTWLNLLLALLLNVLQSDTWFTLSSSSLLEPSFGIQRFDNSTSSATGWTSTMTVLPLFLIISIIISRGKFSTGCRLTLIKRSPGNRPVSFPVDAPGSANITDFDVGMKSDSERSSTMALRRLKPKSWVFRRLMINSRGGGNETNLIGGNGRLTSSNCWIRVQLYSPCDSPTGLSENGGVAKDEFVVSVRLSADGDGVVAMFKLCWLWFGESCENTI